MKSVTTLKEHDVYSKYTSLPRFQIDVSWLVKIQSDEELRYEIDVWFQEKFLTNDALDLIWSPAFWDTYDWLGHCLRQLYFHIYFLFVGIELELQSIWQAAKAIVKF
jgi:hypothetical protein